MIDYQILTTDIEVEAIADEWRALQARSGTSIYSDYDHIAVWRRVLGRKGGRMMHIITARENGTLVGVLPLAVIKRKGFRVLQAVGEEAFYQSDILLEDASLAAGLWDAARKSPHYDYANIRDIVPDSANNSALAAFAQAHDVDPEHGLRIDWMDSEGWMKSISSKLRYNSGRSLRLMNAIAPVTYEVCEAEPVPEDVIEAMVYHKSLWCDAHGMSGMFDQPNILEYFKTLAHDAAARGRLVLAWMKCGEADIFQHLMLTHKGTVYNYVVSTNAEWNKYSPGNLAYINAIGWAIDHGYTFYDHLQGDFPYKEKFTNVTRECREFCFARSLKGAIGLQLFLKERALRRYVRRQKTNPGMIGTVLAFAINAKKTLLGGRTAKAQPVMETVKVAPVVVAHSGMQAKPEPAMAQDQQSGKTGVRREVETKERELTSVD